MKKFTYFLITFSLENIEISGSKVKLRAFNRSFEKFMEYGLKGRL